MIFGNVGCHNRDIVWRGLSKGWVWRAADLELGGHRPFSGDLCYADRATESGAKLPPLVGSASCINSGETLHNPLASNNYASLRGSSFSTGNQYVSGRFANPFPSYSLVWSGEPKDRKKD